MSAVNSFYAFKDATEVGELTTHNTQGVTLTLQIMGDASAFTLEVYGKVDLNSKEWILLNSINATTLEVSTTISNKGIFVIPVEGLGSIQTKLTSVSGGKVSVFGRITTGA